MRRVEQLISIARELSQNQNYDSNSGVSQNVFVQHLKNAQATMLRNFVLAKSKALLNSEITAVVSSQAAYNYPTDIYLQAIDTLEWSPNQIDWKVLEKCITKERLSSSVGYPFGYIPVEDGIILSPPQSSGYLRFNYLRQAKTPEKRAGLISAVTLAAGQITALTVNISDASFDGTYINQDYYLCIVDKYGAVKMSNVPYTSVATGTGVFTMSAFTYASGESAAVGDYIIIGQNVTNKPEFKEMVEDYLIQFMVYSAKFGDASKWTEEAKKQMVALLGEVIEAYAQPDADRSSIPIINTDYLGMF